MASLIALALALVAIAGAMAIVIAVVAPAIGLGRDEAFLGYAAFGWSRGDVATTGAAISGGAVLLFAVSYAVASVLRFWSIRPPGPTRRRIETILQGLAIVGLTLLACLGVAEVYFRATMPFATARWPSRFDPGLGFLFVPGAEVRWTNGVDFWVRERANEFGFLDRAPLGPKPPGTCRVVLVGDSFVEAAQVPIARKVQVALEELARQGPDAMELDSAAIGYSGTGQAAQLPLFERFGRDLRPDVVVLVFVSNDFANNSAILESFTQGWHPRHSPRLFFVPDPLSGEFVRQEIDPDWRAHVFAPPPPAGASALLDVADRALRTASYLYVFVNGHWRARFPAARGIGIYEARARWLASLPEYETALKGWEERRGAWADAAFFEPGPLPAILQEALGATEAALRAYAALAREDGFRLVVLGSHSMRDPSRREGESSQVERLRAILDRLDIPYIDQLAHIRAADGRPEDAQFSRDGHWSAQGHRWAAEAILTWVRTNALHCGAAR
jgi:hypothetical protein